ncbi:MAG: ABC transporter permease [Oscillospiraceae bacterium]|jgi:putative ABC transport system permease protein|nr:ABC transporter permease [Oscillospiraceae bacterium]
MLFYGTTLYGIQTGLCFAVLALGLYISYSILDFPDLSVDGTFPLGGVIATILMLRLGLPPLAAVLLSFFAGVAAGLVTGYLHVRCRISKLLSGIIVMTAMLSVTLALTQLLTKNGYTTAIFSYRSENLKSLFSFASETSLGRGAKDYWIIAVLLVFVIFVKFAIDIFLKTKLGYMLRSTGDNERLVTSLGKDPGKYKILGISLANGLVAMSGALYSQFTLQYDNTSGSGKVVLALASVIIGIAVFSNIRFIKDTTAVIAGALIYSLCLNYLVLVDKNGIYLKLLNAAMFAIILIFNDRLSGLRGLRYKRKGAKRIKEGGSDA